MQHDWILPAFSAKPFITIDHETDSARAPVKVAGRHTPTAARKASSVRNTPSTTGPLRSIVNSLPSRAVFFATTSSIHPSRLKQAAGKNPLSLLGVVAKRRTRHVLRSIRKEDSASLTDYRKEKTRPGPCATPPSHEPSIIAPTCAQQKFPLRIPRSTLEGERGIPLSRNASKETEQHMHAYKRVAILEPLFPPKKVTDTLEPPPPCSSQPPPLSTGIRGDDNLTPPGNRLTHATTGKQTKGIHHAAARPPREAIIVPLAEQPADSTPLYSPPPTRPHTSTPPPNFSL